MQRRRLRRQETWSYSASWLAVGANYLDKQFRIVHKSRPQSMGPPTPNRESREPPRSSHLILEIWMNKVRKEQGLYQHCQRTKITPTIAISTLINFILETFWASPTLSNKTYNRLELLSASTQEKEQEGEEEGGTGATGNLWPGRWRWWWEWAWSSNVGSRLIKWPHHILLTLYHLRSLMVAVPR